MDGYHVTPTEVQVQPPISPGENDVYVPDIYSVMVQLKWTLKTQP